MNAMPFFISRKAVSDLEEIWLFTIEKWSIEQADRYYNLSFDEIITSARTSMQANRWSMCEKVTGHQKSNLILFSTE